MYTNDKEILQSKINDRSITSDDLMFGRKMPFGKYKGQFIYWLVVKHPYYVNWIINHTKFKFTDTEIWLHKECLDDLWLGNLNDLIYDLSKQVQKLGSLPESNPHYIVE